MFGRLFWSVSIEVLAVFDCDLVSWFVRMSYLLLVSRIPRVFRGKTVVCAWVVSLSLCLGCAEFVDMRLLHCVRSS